MKKAPDIFSNFKTLKIPLFFLFWVWKKIKDPLYDRGWLTFLWNNRKRITSFAENEIIMENFTKDKSLVLRGEGNSDWKVFNQVIIQREYDEVLDFVESTIGGRRLLFFDCGANIGLAAHAIHTRFQNTISIGVEPSKENLKLASQNADYEVLHNAVLHSSSNCRFKIDDPSKESYAFSFSEDKEGDIVSLDLETLSRAITPGTYAFLKLDIEGAETEIIENASIDLLERFDLIAIEFHEAISNATPSKKKLKSSGFQHFMSGEYDVYYKTPSD